MGKLLSHRIWFTSAGRNCLSGPNILDSRLPVDAARTGCEIVSSSFFFRTRDAL